MPILHDHSNKQNVVCLEIKDRPRVCRSKVEFFASFNSRTLRLLSKVVSTLQSTGFNITFSHGLGASGPGTMRQRIMNSYFMQRECGRLYRTAKTNQQEYGVEFVLNGLKSSVSNPKLTFLSSQAKSASKLSSTFHASPSEGCTMSPSFSRMPSLCHLMCLAVLLEINNCLK
jgi:hypothetical protein